MAKVKFKGNQEFPGILLSSDPLPGTEEQDTAEGVGVIRRTVRGRQRLLLGSRGLLPFKRPQAGRCRWRGAELHYFP